MFRVIIVTLLVLMPIMAKAENSEKQCLARAVYFEAKSESNLGKQAVAHVVLNRVKSKKFPNTVCGVVYQCSSKGCQFSWVRHKSKVSEMYNWNASLEAADDALNHLSRDPTNGALYFWSTRIKIPKHVRNKKHIRIGGHYFAK